MTETPSDLPELDHYSPWYRDHHHEIYAAYRERCPVGRSEASGGFYFVTRYDDARSVLADHGRYSSLKYQDENCDWQRGVHVPYNQQPPLLPLELDPPQATEYRRAMAPWFTLPRAESSRCRVAELTNELIDRRIGSGELDVVLDVGNPVPAVMTLELIGLPTESWADFAMPMHEIVYAEPGSAAFQHAVEGVARIAEELAKLVAARRSDPRDDLTSTLCRAVVGGEPLADDVVVNVLMTVLGGGVDTTTGALAYAVDWLDRHPEQRRLLAENPGAIAAACDEFIRHGSPSQTLGRTVTEETDLHGVRLRPGDRIMIPTCSANRDESVFTDADEVVLDRSPVRHLAFGHGVHRCIGAHLGRVELQVMLGELLRRVPDFSVDRTRAERYPTIALINGYIRLPITFTPGAAESGS